MTQPISQRLAALVDIMTTMLELIEAHGDEGIPSGHLYALVMRVASIDIYEQMIDILVDAKRVRRGPYHHLIAVKPCPKS